jgi:glycosyltransferase involved in cell wall biosynthesis
VLEAALSGCALVLGDIPSLREVWGEAAVYVRPDDERALARAVTALVHDDAGREARGVAAREHARRYDAAALGLAYARLYRQLTPASQAAMSRAEGR